MNSGPLSLKEEFKNCYLAQIALCYVGWALQDLKKSQEECLDNWGSQIFVFGTRRLLDRMGHVFSVTDRLPLTYITRSTNMEKRSGIGSTSSTAFPPHQWRPSANMAKHLVGVFSSKWNPLPGTARQLRALFTCL